MSSKKGGTGKEGGLTVSSHKGGKERKGKERKGKEREGKERKGKERKKG